MNHNASNYCVKFFKLIRKGSEIVTLVVSVVLSCRFRRQKYRQRKRKLGVKSETVLTNLAAKTCLSQRDTRVETSGNSFFLSLVWKQDCLEFERQELGSRLSSEIILTRAKSYDSPLSSNKKYLDFTLFSFVSSRFFFPRDTSRHFRVQFVSFPPKEIPDRSTYSSLPQYIQKEMRFLCISFISIDFPMRTV